MTNKNKTGHFVLSGTWKLIMYIAVMQKSNGLVQYNIFFMLLAYMSLESGLALRDQNS